MAYTTIDDPSVYFQTTLYTGSDDASATKVVTNGGNSDLQPDWVWFKRRNASANHAWQDTSRGIGNGISSSSGGAEVNDDFGITAIGSDGFSVRENAQAAGEINQGNMVAWQWKVNGGTTTAFNESGNNPGGVHQSNAEAGISIVTYTGTGAAGGTVTHGLGAIPDLIHLKSRDAGEGWVSYWNVPAFTGENGFLGLNSTGGFSDSAGEWNDTIPTSSVFTVGNQGRVNDDAEKYVAYCFKSIQGFSAVGSYIGNGSTNGRFVYTGFKPGWILYRKNASSNWHILDNKRDTIGVNNIGLDANNTNADANDANLQMDFLSNGFKLRTSHATANASSTTYIYWAIAESPFVSSTGAPTTAGGRSIT